MQKSAIYPPVYVLGNGQLGRMLRYAGAPLDIEVKPLAFDAPVFDIEPNSIITAEIERWADTPLTQLLGNHPNFCEPECVWEVSRSFYAKITT